jgi:hypothetical protein
MLLMIAIRCPEKLWQAASTATSIEDESFVIGPSRFSRLGRARQFKDQRMLNCNDDKLFGESLNRVGTTKEQ